MKKSLILVVAVVVATTIFSANLIAQQEKSDGVSTNIKDFRSKGLALIPSVDPFYADNVSQLTRRNESDNAFASIMRPFSVLLRNDNTEAIVAYRLKWTLQSPKGDNVVFYTSYGAPSLLMNMRISRNSSSKFTDSYILRPGNHRLMSLVDSNSIGTSTENYGQPQEILNAAQEFAKSFAKTSFINVELDGAFLANGVFIGAPQSTFFDHMLAHVRAKHDLLTKIKRMLSSKTAANEVFDYVRRVADQPEIEIGANTTAANYYNHFRKVYAQEVLNVRESLKDDSQALDAVLKPLSGGWINLRRENS